MMGTPVLRRPHMLAKIIIVLLLLAILASLMTSMVFLVKDPSKSTRTLTGLKVRILLSFILLGFLLVSYRMGWIHPHAALPPAQEHRAD